MITMQTNIEDFIAGFDGVTKGIERLIAAKVMKTVRFIDVQIHARTPVWSGQAVRNMIWAMDHADTTVHPAIEEPHDPGRTSEMALGTEPRRAANAEAARQSLGALDFSDPFHAYVLANQSPDIGLIEEGTAGLPGKSRAPNGVFAVTMAEVIARLQSGSLE